MFSGLPRRLVSRLASARTFSSARSSQTLAAGALVGTAAGTALVFSLGPKDVVSAEGVSVDVSQLEKRVQQLERQAGCEKHSAFVFIKPHAVYDKVKALTTERLAENGITVISEGVIPAEVIDKKQLIDTHYGAIAAKAVKLKPASLTVQTKAQDQFKATFGQSWSDALKEGKVYNAMDGAAKLGITTNELGAKWGTLKKDVTLLKFGGGFYCGKVDGIYILNGFYMDMRAAFTKPGTCIHYYEVEWNPNKLSWADFRGKVLGGTDPKTAAAGSLRREVFDRWQELGLKSCPNTGDNGCHASASPFEALAERNNWLGVPLTDDFYGKAMLAYGVPLSMAQSWCEDPPVMYDGKKQSLFDLLEDLDARECLKKSASISAANI